MRPVLIVLATIAVLAGCQKKEEIGFTTDSPLVSADDETGAPSLKSGDWAKQSEGCDYDPNKSTSAWPECVTYLVVRGHEVRWRSDAGFGPYLLAGGDPRVMQELTVSSEGNPLAYRYSGLRSAAFDAAGRIARMRLWTVHCPPAEESGKGPSCEPTNLHELRALARAGDEWAELWIWVRDGTE